MTEPRHPQATMLAFLLAVAGAGLTMAACSQPNGSSTMSTETMSAEAMTEFATRYTKAWCSQDPASVAAFFSEEGSLRVNDGAPAVGRDAITAVATGFMTTFPDLVVLMDELKVEGDRVEYHWTLDGTNTGPGGTGNHVRVSGFEEWRFSSEGLIEESRGHFDADEYQRQLDEGYSDGS